MGIVATLTTPADMVHKFQFGVEIDGFEQALFQKCNLPEIEFDEATFGGAGSYFDMKLPGRAKFADIVLELGTRADTASDEVLEWIEQQVDLAQHRSSPPSEFLRDLAIIQYTRPGLEYRRWNVHGAWVKKYVPGEGDGASSDIQIRQVTLTYQYYTTSR